MKISVRFSSTRHAERLLASAIVCSMLLVLPACGIPNLRQAMPGPNLPASYTAGFNGLPSLENSSQVPIEDFFNDPKLTSLICQALAGGNQELRILYEDVQIAQYEVLGRSGAYLPFVSLGLGAGMEKFSRYNPLGAAEEQLEYLPGKHFPGLPGNFLAVFDVSWEIDIWRRLRNLRDAAKLRFLATNEGRNYVITRLVAEIADNYYMLMSLDKRIENLDNIIAIQQRTLKVATDRFEQARSNKFPVLRFQADVRRNQSQRLITQQAIVQVENHINFLVGRYPQPVERRSANLNDFIDLSLHALSLGVPAQLLQNRPDIRQAERELEAAGLDVKAARARFFPQLAIAGPTGPAGPYAPIGVQAFTPQYLFSPGSLLVSVAADLITPVINKRGLRAEYKTANARQLQAVYNYQRVLLNAFTEVVTRVTKVQNYSSSIEIKKQQVAALREAVKVTTDLYLAPRLGESVGGGYLDVLIAQRDLWEAIFELIETKQEQLSGIVNTYQALGGGLLGCGFVNPKLPQPGPSLAQSQQGGSDQTGADQLHSPRMLPDQSPGPNPAQPGSLPESGKPPTSLPPPGPKLE